MEKAVAFDQKRVAFAFRDADPIEIIRWGVTTLGASSLAFACSFGYEDVALVDMILKVDQNVDIFFINTHLLFSETHQVKRQLEEKYGCSFLEITPQLTLDQQSKRYGDELWKRDPNQCCSLRKVAPLKGVLSHYKGWMTGIRREQSKTRAHTEVVEWDETFGLWKLNPLAYWKEKQVWDYIHQHQIPYNPLHDQHYPSIGCYPCTQPVKPGEDPRSGRWAGFVKVECGLHPSSQKNNKLKRGKHVDV